MMKRTKYNRYSRSRTRRNRPGRSYPLLKTLKIHLTPENHLRLCLVARNHRMTKQAVINSLLEQVNCEPPDFDEPDPSEGPFEIIGGDKQWTNHSYQRKNILSG